MGRSLKLGQIRGITIGVHYSWLIVFALLSYSLAVGVFPLFFSGWSTIQYWAVSVIASILFFVSVLAHELGHSFMAQQKGIPVQSITLFLFGGASAIGQETDDAGDELQIAMAGPSISVMVAIVSFGIGYVTQSVNEQVSAIFLFVSITNVILVAFNLIPGYPLDGGRLLRSLIWGFTGNFEVATKITATFGVVIGYLFIVGGILFAFRDLISGIWLIAIGWFLQSAAGQSYGQRRYKPVLEGVQGRVDHGPEPGHRSTGRDHQ
jgi:Zn-dependent protease